MTESNSSTKQRVLVIHWGQNGAGPRFALHFTETLEQLGQYEIFLSYNRNADIAERLAAIPVRNWPVSTYRTKTGVVLGLPKLIWLSLRLRRLISQLGIDVVFSPLESLWQVAAAPLYLPRGVRYVNSVHDGDFHPGDEMPLRTLIRRIDFGRTDRFVVFSTSVADALRRQGITKPIVTSVLPAFPVEHAPQPRSLPTGRPPRIGLFGALRPYKGIDTFVALARDFQGHENSPSFEILGDGPDEVVPTDLPTNLTVDRRWVADEQLLAELSRFDVIVLPYTEASQSAVFAWAMSLGIPAVVTPVGGLQEQALSTGGGLVAHGLDAHAVKDALDEVLASPTTYSRLSANGLEAAASTHSWERVVADVIATFPP